MLEGRTRRNVCREMLFSVVLIGSERLRGMVRRSPADSLCLYIPTEKARAIFLHVHYQTSSLGSNSSSLTKVHRIRRKIHPQQQSLIDAIGLAIEVVRGGRVREE
jgi:hypothetical protein